MNHADLVSKTTKVLRKIQDAIELINPRKDPFDCPLLSPRGSFPHTFTLIKFPLANIGDHRPSTVISHNVGVSYPPIKIPFYNPPLLHSGGNTETRQTYVSRLP